MRFSCLKFLDVTWKKHRKALQPAFGQKYLDSYVKKFVNHSTILTNKLAREVGNKDVDIVDYISRCSLDMICGELY